MSIATAQILFACIATVEFLVWLFGFQLIRATMKAAGPRQPDEKAFADGEARSPAFHFGSVEVEGQPATLMETAVNILVRDSAFNTGAVKISRRTEDTLAFD